MSHQTTHLNRSDADDRIENVVIESVLLGIDQQIEQVNAVSLQHLRAIDDRFLEGCQSQQLTTHARPLAAHSGIDEDEWSARGVLQRRRVSHLLKGSGGGVDNDDRC